MLVEANAVITMPLPCFLVKDAVFKKVTHILYAFLKIAAQGCLCFKWSQLCIIIQFVPQLPPQLVQLRLEEELVLCLVNIGLTQLLHEKD